MNLKNIAKGTFESFKVEDGLILLKSANTSTSQLNYQYSISKDYIQFHFCLKGYANFLYNEGAYIFSVQHENSILLYNPDKELPINLVLEQESQVLSILISIKKFHGLFSNEADQISFLNNENVGNKLYKEKKIGPMIAIVLNQMFQQSMDSTMYTLYLRGKVFELMSLYFSKDKEMDVEQCPFLADDNNIKKIKLAKEIMISRMIEPPTLTELSNEVDISLKKLKQGFKQVYGSSVYSFLLDYKMQTSKRLLSSGSYNVNEVALKVGYSTATHFINAFKKKFGTTPKKYLMSI